MHKRAGGTSPGPAVGEAHSYKKQKKRRAKMESQANARQSRTECPSLSAEQRESVRRAGCLWNAVRAHTGLAEVRAAN